MSAEERMQVLRMIESGQISAQEGGKILEAMRPAAAAPTVRASVTPRWLRVRVKGQDSETVNVNVPLQLAEVALRMIPANLLRTEGGQVLDIEAIQEAIRTLGEAGGKIVEVHGSDGEQVEVFVE